MSLILLGILNSQVTGGGAGAYDLLETQVLTSSASSVTFSSIPQDYKHLQIRYVIKKDEAASFASFHQLQFNSDSSSSYNAHYLHGTGSSFFVSSQGTSTFMQWAYVSDGSTDANAYTAGVMDILDYASTSKNTTVRNLHGYQSPQASRIMMHSGLWINTSAVSSIYLAPNSGNYRTGSRFSLYGIRG